MAIALIRFVFWAAHVLWRSAPTKPSGPMTRRPDGSPLLPTPCSPFPSQLQLIYVRVYLLSKGENAFHIELTDHYDWLLIGFVRSLSHCASGEMQQQQQR